MSGRHQKCDKRERGSLAFEGCGTLFHQARDRKNCRPSHRTVKGAIKQALLVTVQARPNRLADTAGLFQALGGGWWNSLMRSQKNR